MKNIMNKERFYAQNLSHRPLYAFYVKNSKQQIFESILQYFSYLSIKVVVVLI